MTATALPLESLEQQIARQQSELEVLRREYAARQTRLAELNRRKAELEAKLSQIEAQIQAVARGEAAVTSRPAPSRRPAASTRTVKSSRRQKLPALLVEMVRHAKGPLTARQIADELLAKKYPTKSNDLARIVQTRMHELVAKGIFQRAKDQPGVVLAGAKHSNVLQAANGTITKTKATKSAASSNTASRVERNGRSKVPLRLILAKILAKSRQPVNARDLAQRPARHAP